MTTGTIYLRHESGRNDALSGRRLAKLLRELKAGRGGPEVCALQNAGYTETMGGLHLSGFTYELVSAEARGVFATQRRNHETSNAMRSAPPEPI